MIGTKENALVDLKDLSPLLTGALVQCSLFKDSFTPEAVEHSLVDIPAEYAEAAEEARQHLVEKVAETDDGLMEKFLEEEEISEEELKIALRKVLLVNNDEPINNLSFLV